jgi:hypothetical protein
MAGVEEEVEEVVGLSRTGATMLEMTHGTRGSKHLMTLPSPTMLGAEE